MYFKSETPKHSTEINKIVCKTHNIFSLTIHKQFNKLFYKIVCERFSVNQSMKCLFVMKINISCYMTLEIGWKLC